MARTVPRRALTASKGRMDANVVTSDAAWSAVEGGPSVLVTRLRLEERCAAFGLPRDAARCAHATKVSLECSPMMLS